MKKNKGMYWLPYHNTLISWCCDYEGRREIIATRKPPHERAVRLQWFLAVKDKLPEEFVKAAREFAEAIQKSQKIWQALHEHYPIDCSESKEADENVTAAQIRYEMIFRNCKAEIEALHKQECPGCPWDGEQLVFDEIRK